MKKEALFTPGKLTRNTQCVKKEKKKETTGASCHLEHQVDCASVGGDGHSAPLWNRLVGSEGGDGLRVSQGLDLQTVLLHHRRGGRVHALEITFAKETFLSRIYIEIGLSK